MVEQAYRAYLEKEPGTRTKLDTELEETAETVAEHLEKGELDQSDLDFLEEQTAQAAFYAGFKAALAMLNELR